MPLGGPQPGVQVPLEGVELWNMGPESPTPLRAAAAPWLPHLACVSAVRAQSLPVTPHDVTLSQATHTHTHTPARFRPRVP